MSERPEMPDKFFGEWFQDGDLVSSDAFALELSIEGDALLIAEDNGTETQIPLGLIRFLIERNDWMKAHGK